MVIYFSHERFLGRFYKTRLAMTFQCQEDRPVEKRSVCQVCGLFLGSRCLRWTTVDSLKKGCKPCWDSLMNKPVPEFLDAELHSWHRLYLKGCMPYQHILLSLHLVHPHPSCPTPLPQYSGDYWQLRRLYWEWRAGPDPSVSPRLKGSDYMEN